MSQLLTKSIKLSREDAISLNEIVRKDPRIERGLSEALRICYEDAAMNIPQWKTVLEEAEHLDYSGDSADASRESSTISFLIGEDVFSRVLASVREQLGYARPRGTFITRLCIKAARCKLIREASSSAASDNPPQDIPRSDNSAANRIIPGLSLEEFKDLDDTDEKLNAIYKKLLELQTLLMR